MFLAVGTDASKNVQYGYRYNPNDLTKQHKFRNLPASSYNVTPSSTAFWAGDTFGSSSVLALAYVRLYIDYFPTSGDQMMDLATMNQGSKHLEMINP